MAVDPLWQEIQMVFSLKAFTGRYTGLYGPLDWYSAKAHCEALGQKLMTIDSQDEEDHVQSTLRPTEA